MSGWNLDAGASHHRKILYAGNEAFGAMARAGAWSIFNGTDGFIPKDAALGIARPPVWARLVQAGLAHVVLGGWQLHDFLDWNLSADDMAKKASARARAGTASGASRRNKTRTYVRTDVQHVNEQNDIPRSNVAEIRPLSLSGSSSLPSPSASPLPSDLPAFSLSSSNVEVISAGAREGKPHPLPDDWEPSAETISVLKKEKFPGAIRLLPMFKDHWCGRADKDAKKPRWDSAFRNWVRRETRDYGQRLAMPVAATADAANESSPVAAPPEALAALAALKSNDETFPDFEEQEGPVP